jgi:pseudaminic acid cytidylyltransferase
MNIAIIPARGGSKRILRKNIRDFYGHPILKYSIDAAQRSGLFDKIIVTTDDAEIAEIAKSYNVEVPFLRPEHLSDDFAGTTAVVSHALKWLKEAGEKYEFVCTIYATAPFLSSEQISKGYRVLKSSAATNAFSATASRYPIQRMFKINEQERCEMFFPENFESRSQDLEEAYHDAGQFYWSRVSDYGKESMFAQSSIPVVLPGYLVQDIDSEDDWVMAEIMYKVLLEANLLK